MSLSNAALAEFGRNLGFSELQMPPSGALMLDFERRGTLYLEDYNDDLLIYLLRPIAQPEDTLKTLKTALQRCHYRQGLPYAVQVGLSGDTDLLFLVRLPSHDVTLPELERTLDTLTTLHDAVQT